MISLSRAQESPKYAFTDSKLYRSIHLGRLYPSRSLTPPVATKAPWIRRPFQRVTELCNHPCAPTKLVASGGHPIAVLFM